MPQTTAAEVVNMSAKKKKNAVKKALKMTPEEEERRRKEEEEARLLAEQEEQERLEREKKEEEERLRLELKDRERKEDELNELHLMLEENQKKVNMWETAAKEKAEWDRYMICDGSPNPAVQPEINTFMTLWKENPGVDIQTILQECALALQLTEELELLLSKETEPGIIQVYQDTLRSLQSLIHAKHQAAAEKILMSARTCSDIDTGNMHTTVRDDHVTLCLWANIKKNPRFKGYHFQEAGLGFELPKQLAVSDTCVRILHARYDHLSHLSLQTQAQNKKSPAREEVVEADVEVAVEDERKESVQEEKDEIRSIKSSGGKKSRDSMHSGKSRKKTSLEPMDDPETVVEGVSSSGEAEEADSEPTVAEPATNSTEQHIVDLHRYTPLGGVYYFDLFHLPSQIFTINSWEMKEILDTGLQAFPYPSEQPHISASENPEDTSTQSSSPVGVTVVLPESVIFMQEPQVARWDPVGQHWRTDCITMTSYNSEERSLAIKMDSFYTFTVLQETHINMPFQYWELRPHGVDSVTLTITGAHTEVSISVQGNQCMLQMDSAPGLNHILGKWLSLPALQTAMRRAGVNVFVNEYSDKYVTVGAKDSLMEHAAYEQMALVSSAVAFSRSQWNAQCGQEHLVLQVCEHLEAGLVPEEAWSLYIFGAQKCQRLKMTEKSDTFSPELAKESEFHATFLHMLRDVISPEGQDKLHHTHYLFVDTVQRLLCATRLLTFS